MDPLELLEAAILDAAERGDAEGVDALAALEDDPEGLAAWVKADALTAVVESVEYAGEWYTPDALAWVREGGSRAGLVKVVITNRLGHKQTVYRRATPEPHAADAAAPHAGDHPAVDLGHKDPEHPVAKRIAADREAVKVVAAVKAAAAERDAKLAGVMPEVERLRAEDMRSYRDFLSADVPGEGKSRSPDAVEAKRLAWVATADKLTAARRQADAHRREAKTSFVAAMKPAAPLKPVVVTGDAALPERVTATHSTAESWLASTCGAGAEPVMYRLDGVAAGQRSFCVYGRPGAFSRVAMSEDAPPATAVHEIGHAVEASDPEVKRRCQEFLNYRCGSEPPVSMKDKFPRRGYTADELVRKDQFDRAFPEEHAYYVGKKYEDGSTEVLSMGMEKLYKDPVGFVEKDPEYAAFVIGIMRGTR